ncbi:MAG: hypothetical protein HYZ92_03025 [Candidatus Omnitrophica bacterium]|nr:hypothetical protein [Candidatus Omnitrophota bacterium]
MSQRNSLAQWLQALSICGLLASAFTDSLAFARDTGQTISVLSKTYTIDRIYRSMKGPASTQEITLFDARPPELLWITGYEAVMVGADGKTPMPQAFMCHSNLDFDPSLHHQRFHDHNPVTSRLFTLSQGQFSISFPRGFGLPVMSDEPLSLTTQVLNHNIADQTFLVRHKVTVHFIRDRDLKRPLKPLFSVGAYGLALLHGDQPYFNVAQADPAVHGPGCLPGVNASTNIYQDPLGRTFTGHWVVKPGREVNRTLVTKLLNLPYDTTVHYSAVHLHPFAESLELRDLTTGKRVFRSHVKASRGKIGIDRVDAFSSRRGLPLYKDHDYELVSVYNNTTFVDQDSMAVMYLYLLDKTFMPHVEKGMRVRLGEG